jgi:hypothetical protein
MTMVASRLEPGWFCLALVSDELDIAHAFVDVGDEATYLNERPSGLLTQITGRRYFRRTAVSLRGKNLVHFPSSDESQCVSKLDEKSPPMRY